MKETKLGKIINDLSNIRYNKKDKLVICYGHFNVIHPGHIQYLEFAKKFGNFLILAVKQTNTEHKNNGNYFSLEQRCKGVSSLDIVDGVIPLYNYDIHKIITEIEPEFFVLGKEHENTEEKILQKAIHSLKHKKGRMVFYTGSFKSSTSGYLFDDISNIKNERIKTFVSSCKSQNIKVENMLGKIDTFSSSSILVIGDTIVDQYIDCNALGMSSEAPVIVVQEKESKGFLGGAAIVASHIKSLGANCKYLSVAGDDHVRSFVERELNKQDINNFIIKDNERPTTYKTRYLVDNQKVFRVSRLNENNISKSLEEEIISKIEKEISTIQGLLISDFVYGVITKRVLEHVIYLAKKHKKLLFGDLQCSSQVGYITKFLDFDLICPTEKEARIALKAKEFGIEWISNQTLEKTRSKNLVMKLGAEGFISYETKKDGFVNRQYFPALNVTPLDVTGAGDSLIAGLAVGLTSGLSLMEASALGAIISSIAVQNMGNLPVRKKQIIEYLEGIKNYE